MVAVEFPQPRPAPWTLVELSFSLVSASSQRRDSQLPLHGVASLLQPSRVSFLLARAPSPAVSSRSARLGPCRALLQLSRAPNSLLGPLLFSLSPMVVAAHWSKLLRPVGSPWSSPSLAVFLSLSVRRGRIALVGKLGDDVFGRILAAILRNNGANGEREFMFYRNLSVV
jgi:hypothetical protein